MNYITEEDYMNLLVHMTGRTLTLAEASTELDKRFIIDDELADAQQEDCVRLLTEFL